MARRPRHARGKRTRPAAARGDGRTRGGIALASPPANPKRAPRTAPSTESSPAPDESRAPSHAPRAARSSRVIVWQVRGCAALCALAAATGMLCLVDEIHLQMGAARNVVGWAATAICAGVACGLWMPRRIIRQRLRMHGQDGSAEQSGVEFEFAATLTGVLILALGVLWALLIGLATGMEGYRTFLARGFLHPPGLTLALLLAPVLAGLALLGAVGTTVLVALHGWQRLIGGTGTGVTTLWLAMLLAGTIGAGAGWLTARPEALATMTLLATFGAGVLAVCRKPTGTAHPAVRPSPPEHVIGRPLRLLAVAATALATGTALAAAVPLEVMTIRSAAGGMGVLSLSLLVGMLMARRLARVLPDMTDETPLLLLAIGVVWSWPGLGAVNGYGNIVRVALMGCVAAASALLAGRRVAATLEGVQPAVARVGGALALGLSLGLVLGPAWLSWQQPQAVAIIIALSATVAAGAAWLRQNTGRRALRSGGLAATGLLLAVVAFQAGWVSSADDNHEASTRVDETDPIDCIGRGLLESSELDGVIVGRDGGITGETSVPDGPHSDVSLISGWHADLAGSGHDIVIVARPASRAAAPLSPEHARRLLRRCDAALLTGGRLAVELPADDLAAAALGLESVGGVRVAAGGYLVNVSGPGGEYAVLLRGRDVPSWIHDWGRPAGCEVRHCQVRDLADLRARLTSPDNWP